MGQIKVTPTPLSGVYLIEPTCHGDARGYFIETYNQRDMLEAGLDMTFVQDNESMSRKGVLRGLHFQIAHPQGKLVRALVGTVFDAVVDIRPGSATYGHWYGAVLSAENHYQLYVSPGFAHGYLTLSDTAVFAYKVTDFYHPGDEGGIAWNDPAIGITWPDVTGAYPGSAASDGYRMADGSGLLINARDQQWPTLADKNT